MAELSGLVHIDSGFHLLELVFVDFTFLVSPLLLEELVASWDGSVHAMVLDSLF